MVHELIKTTGGKGTFINLVSLGASFLNPGISAYSSAQLAAIKFGEYVDAEKPDLRYFSVHPGLVEAEEGRGMVIDSFTPLPRTSRH